MRKTDEAYRKLCSDVLRRDKYRCKFPGCKKKGTQIHHIKTWATTPLLRYSKENLISLCFRHHKMIWNNESEYEKIFFDIIRRKP